MHQFAMGIVAIGAALHTSSHKRLMRRGYALPVKKKFQMLKQKALHTPKEDADSWPKSKA